MIQYQIKEDWAGRFWVFQTDENGEVWEADLDGFNTQEEAEAFMAKVQVMQDSIGE